jgi:hypothetical protein
MGEQTGVTVNIAPNIPRFRMPGDAKTGDLERVKRG